ncbi:MAG: LytTR family DNA-binding domain-containing protein [Acetatifactor sp.]|nr:LytTR family DNA-binding domain-containing protein [Acetatifactor sp.]
MKIAYCEDEPAQAILMQKRIEAWAEKNRIACTVDLYQSAEEFLFRSEKFQYDVLLLDIAMNRMDGMELARRIREYDREARLVFLTSDSSRVFEGYEVNAFRYLMKPVDEKKLIAVLDQLEEQLHRTSDDSVILRVDGENIRVECSGVTYLEVCGHYVQIHMSNGERVEQKDSFSHVLSLFNERAEWLVTTHRSFAVNPNAVKQVGRTECTLMDDTRIPVSRAAYKHLTDAFIKCNLRE